MKSLSNLNFLVIILLMFSSLSCESSKNATNEKYAPMNLSKISVEKISMSGRDLKEITAKEIQQSTTDRSGVADAVKGLNKSDSWKEIQNLVSEIDLKDMNSWEAPTQERFHDGARATTILIEANGEEYSSQSFDEGNPPAELKKLYDYLESL